jgi:NitT/TauT family transport system permease protein
MRSAVATRTVQRHLVLYACSVASLLIVWQLSSARFPLPMFYPSPVTTGRALVALFRDGLLVQDIAASLARIGAGFAIGGAVGVLLGLAMGSFRLVRLALDPYVNFLRFISAIALIPLVMLWFGIDETAKILLIAYTTSFIVMLNTMAGVFAVHRNKLRAARSMGATQWQTFSRVTFPATIRYSVTGLRIAMTNSFMTVVTAEMVAANAGLGYLIFSSRLWMAMDRIFVGIVVLGVCGFLADRLIVLAESTLLARYQLPN